jgi:beta-glucosidase
VYKNPNAPTESRVKDLLGDYTAPQDSNQVITVLKGIQHAVSPTTIVRYAKGCAIRDTTQSNIEEAVEVAKISDAVVLVVGGSSARDFKTEYLETGAAAVSNKKEETIPDMESGEGYDRCTIAGRSGKIDQCVGQNQQTINHCIYCRKAVGYEQCFGKSRCVDGCGTRESKAGRL